MSTLAAGTATGRKVAPGHAVAEVLRANGVEVVFGLNGDHILKLYEGLADTPAITHVTVKHENNAALAAEAYGRLTGRPGVVVVTAGPGALNSLSGVASAYAAGAPVVHISGAVPTGAALEAFHGVDDVDSTVRAFAPVTKASLSVTCAAEIPDTLQQAFALAVAGRPGPVHVEIPLDVLQGEPFDAPVARAAPLPDATPSPDLDQVLARLRAARRPVLVAGKGAWYPIASAALVALAGALGAPVAHSWDGHAAMPTVHPLSLGPYRGQQSHPAVLEALEAADLVLGVGVRPGTEAARTLRAGTGDRLLLLAAADRPDPARAPLAGGTSTRAARLPAGDRPDPAHTPRIDSVPALAATLRALAANVQPIPGAADVRRLCAEAQHRLARGLDVELARYADARPWHVGLALAALAERMTPDLIVTSDVSNVKLWAPLQLRTFGPHSHVQAGSWGTMGYALPAALGAAMACRCRKVVALAGDASFLMSCSDLVTLVQHRLPVVVAVHHDGRLGMIEYMQTVVAGRTPYATEVGDVDYVRLAEAAGLQGIRVVEPSQIGSAWDRALAARGPVLMELLAGHQFPRPSVGRFVQQAAEP